MRSFQILAFQLTFGRGNINFERMRYFWSFLLGLLMFVDYSAADRIQDFIDVVTDLYKAYESKLPMKPVAFFQDIDFYVKEDLTKEDIKRIFNAKVPSHEEMPKLLKKQCTQLERIIFAKILLLSLAGQPRQAEDLLNQLDDALLYTDVAILPSHPWVILLNCIGISYMLHPMERYKETLATPTRDEDVITDEEEDYLLFLKAGEDEKEAATKSYDDADEFLQELLYQVTSVATTVH
jgi:hypothetical protein